MFGFNNLIKKWVGQYIKKYWSDLYLLKSDLEKEFDSIRKNEQEIQLAYWANEMEVQDKAWERKNIIEITKMQGEVKRMQEIVDDANLKARHAEDVYFLAVTGAQGNVEVATELKIKINEVRDILAKLSGSMEKVFSNAHDKLKHVEDTKKRKSILYDK